MTQQEFNLDMIPNGVAPIVHVSQYDKGQQWLFNLFYNNVVFEIPPGAVVTIQATKKDNTGFQYECSYFGNTVVVEETDQMTLFADKYPAEIVVTDNGSVIGSLNFYIQVEPAPLKEDTTISETQLPLLEEAIQAAADAIQRALDAEAWAVGTRNGQAVPSTDETYENNAKYYALNCIGMITDAQWAQILTILN